MAATNRWRSFSVGQRLVDAHDEYDYRTIALAAPHLPRVGVDNQHAQEFAPSYLVGLIAHGLGIGVDGVFRGAAIVVILGVCLALHCLLQRSGVSTPVYAVCMALLVLNAYSLRYYLIAPGYIGDIAFVLCVGLALNALLAGRYMPLLLALIAAVLTRQSALPLAVAVTWWVAWGAGWREATTAVRVARAAGVVIVTVATYTVILLVVSSFSIPDTPGIAGLTVLGDLEHLGANVGALAMHLLRVAHPLFAVICVSAAVLLLRRRSAENRLGISFETIGCFVVGCAIAGQALLLNTHYSGHPERLTVLSLLPFIASVAYLLRDCERAGLRLLPRPAGVIVVVIGIGSLQYLFTSVGPSTAAEGVAVQLVAAMVAGGLVWGASSARTGDVAGAAA